MKLEGPIVHLHLRPLGVEPDEIYQQSENIQFTVEAFLEYARKFTGNPMVRIVDSDHPALILSPDYSAITDKYWFYPSQINKTITILSSNVIKRAGIIRNSHLGHFVLTGTETDILDQNGLLDVNDEALNMLDLVIASLHFQEYAAYSELKTKDRKLELENVLQVYCQVVQNPKVDVLGHPTRDIQARNKDLRRLEAWIPLFQLMHKRGVAYEINLGHLDLRREDAEFDRQLIRLAAKNNAPFLICFDLHNLVQFGSEVSSKLIVDISNCEEIFEMNRGKPNIKFLLLVLKNFKIITELLAGNEELILNASKERFDEWLGSR